MHPESDMDGHHEEVIDPTFGPISKYSEVDEEENGQASDGLSDKSINQSLPKAEKKKSPKKFKLPDPKPIRLTKHNKNSVFIESQIVDDREDALLLCKMNELAQKEEPKIIEEIKEHCKKISQNSTGMKY